MKIYIAGPMSGIPEFNFPEFFRAEASLKAEGYEVFNPASKDAEKELDAEAFKTGDYVAVNKAGFDFRAAYLWDVEHVIKADGILMLQGWRDSPGAVGEYAVALALKKHCPDYRIMYFD